MELARAFVLNPLGKRDSLYQSGEVRLLTKNLGAYQGEGRLSEPCAFSPGARGSIMTNNRLVSASVAVGLAVVSTQALAQELPTVQVQGSSSSADVLLSKNTSTASQDRRAVHGISTPAPYWGIGGYFEGGYMGVFGSATLSGTGSRYGGYFMAANGLNNYGVFGSAPTGANNYAGYFSGNVFISGTLTQPSDLELKTNLKDLQEGTLSQVLRLRPKTYRYLPSASMNGLSLPTGDQVGFVAQDVAQIFPDLVTEVSVPSPVKGRADEKFLSVDYVKIVPLLVKALQEQQTQINALKAQVGMP
jgi:hypothetical protein